MGGYEDINSTAQLIKLGGITCLVASLDTIIRSKEAANRPKDQASLPELRALKMMKEREQKGGDR